jgi:hypothetical protein
MDFALKSCEFRGQQTIRKQENQLCAALLKKARTGLTELGLDTKETSNMLIAFRAFVAIVFFAPATRGTALQNFDIPSPTYQDTLYYSPKLVLSPC